MSFHLILDFKLVRLLSVLAVKEVSYPICKNPGLLD